MRTPALTLLALAFGAPALAGPLPAAEVAMIEALIAEEIAAKNLPGAAVAVSIPGRGDYVGATGTANLETGAARVPSDPFRIASITKTIIGTIMLQLVDEGKLALSDPLAN